MLKRIVLAAALACAAAGGAMAAGKVPPELLAMRKAFAAAVGKHDVKAVATMTQFPLAFSGYEHPDTVTAAGFADEFDGMFFSGDTSLAKCLSKAKLNPSEADFPNSPWVIDCDGNEYYFGLRGGAWMFTAYENVNE